MDTMVRKVIQSIGLVPLGLIGMAGLLLVTACGEPADPARPQSEAPAAVTGSDEERVIHLYFADRDHTVLMAEQRALPAGIPPAETGLLAMQALLKGPKQRLARTIREGTQLRAFYILENRTAYIDLTRAFRDHHPGGARSELLTIYSIVNTLTMNMSEIESVKILIEGQEVITLAGHVDLRYPLRANLLYVR